MKKLLSLLLVLVMVLSLTVCSASAEEKVTLHLYGTANFVDVGAEGMIDLVSGVEMPGYNELIALWNEKYPMLRSLLKPAPGTTGSLPSRPQFSAAVLTSSCTVLP